MSAGIAVRYELLRNIEHIWHLCEILFLDVQPGTAYLQQLQRWVQSRSLLETRMEELFKEDEPHLSPDYWDHVYMLVLQASLEDARRLLKRHPCSSRDDFIMLDELLQSAPQGSIQVASRELHVWWQTWQAQCARHLADGEFSLLPEMEVICKILMGDKDTLRNLRELCKTWYNYLVTLLTYTRPTDEPHMLADLAEDCLAAFGGLEATRGLDSILLAAFRFDLPQVIQEASLFLDNWWFSAHLSDLLFHAGQMEASHAEYASELREHLILEYAASLMTHHSLWQVGVGYLDHCPRRGREYLEAFIEHIPLKTQAQALKVVEILERREMPAVKDICQTLAVRMAKKGQLGIALTWAMRCKNPVLTSRLADQFLAEYTERRELPCLDMLENMGESMLFSDRLTFLANYREFQRKPPGQAAARLLTDLIDSQLAPHLTYTYVELRPGANLNVIVGTNGSGKSSLVCAICLGLCGTPHTVGRASNVSDYIRHGANAALIEIELSNTSGPNTIIERRITSSKSTWKINGVATSHKTVEGLVAKLNIQVNNLCQFLPQDRVADFVRMSRQELLEGTERAVGSSELFDLHQRLKELQQKRATLEASLKGQKTRLEQDRQKVSHLDSEVKKFQEHKEVQHRIERMRQKLAWMEYEDARHLFLEEKNKLRDEEQKLKVKEQAQALLQTAVDKVAKLQAIITTRDKQLKAELADDSKDVETSLQDLGDLADKNKK
ncbi:hypothetical protein HPB50_017686 [Hyalomma asiaticum]|uniref:Uncharacterized protein n=1 Tax=Hyalomma asiaticum TaxID=266040 RepID=A0ACB7SGH7_HYAAI|nr:hypothetical protein HPB50_017686 [Hyalomma asiaticum]